MFIPNRSATDFEASHFKMMRENLSECEMMSPCKREYQRVMAENLQKPDRGAWSARLPVERRQRGDQPSHGARGTTGLHLQRQVNFK